MGCYQATIINASADSIWKVIRDFHDLSWSPNVVESVTVVGDVSGVEVGAKRVLNDVFHETLHVLDDASELSEELREINLPFLSRLRPFAPAFWWWGPAKGTNSRARNRKEEKMELILATEITGRSESELSAIYAKVTKELTQSEYGTAERRNALASLGNVVTEP